MPIRRKNKTTDLDAPAPLIPSESEGSPSREGKRPGSMEWDDSNLHTVYANVANVSTSREEIVLLFGTMLGWAHGQEEQTIELSERVILTPSTAKRFLTVLTRIIGEYENRFDSIAISPPRQAPEA